MQMRFKNVGKMGVMCHELRFKVYDMKCQILQQHCFFFRLALIESRQGYVNMVSTSFVIAALRKRQQNRVISVSTEMLIAESIFIVYFRLMRPLSFFPLSSYPIPLLSTLLIVQLNQ